MFTLLSRARGKHGERLVDFRGRLMKSRVGGHGSLRLEGNDAHATTIVANSSWYDWYASPAIAPILIAIGVRK